MTHSCEGAGCQVLLGDITISRAGKTPSRGEPAYWGGPIPWVSAKDLKRHRLSGSLESITEQAINHGAPLAQPDDILILVRGMTLLKNVPIGLVETPMSFNQDVRCLRPGPNVSGEYLSYVLAMMRQRLLGLVTQAGNGTGRIESGQLAELSLRLPPLGVQQRIARVLRDCDVEISLLDQLSESYRAQKRALMQRLLSGGASELDPTA